MTWLIRGAEIYVDQKRGLKTCHNFLVDHIDWFELLKNSLILIQSYLLFSQEKTIAGLWSINIGASITCIAYVNRSLVAGSLMTDQKSTTPSLTSADVNLVSSFTSFPSWSGTSMFANATINALWKQKIVITVALLLRHHSAKTKTW